MTTTLLVTQQVIQSFKAGDKSAFTPIFNEFYRPLFFFCKELVNDNPDAEDIASETLIKLWKRHENFDSVLSIKAFLFITARNACFDLLKMKKNTASRAENYSSLKAGHDDHHLCNLVAAENAALMALIFKQLPPRKEQILRMFFLDGKKAPEIAEELNLDVDTVYQHKNEGLKQLRNNITLLQRLFLFLIILVMTLYYRLRK